MCCKFDFKLYKNVWHSGFRLLSENKIIGETAGKSKENESSLERKLTELTAKHKRLLDGIEKDEFSFEQFEILNTNQKSLTLKCQTLSRENAASKRTIDKWKKKFTNLR